MSATCEFYGECSLNGMVPIEFNDWEQIDHLERSLPFDFEHEEFIFTNRKGKSFCVEGITVDTALRLYDLGAALLWLRLWTKALGFQGWRTKIKKHLNNYWTGA